jgi:Domain of unknown function (DUF222)/HNH endonuclease
MTTTTVAGPISESEAVGLAEQIQGVAARQALMDHELLRLLGELDAGGGIAWFAGITSTAHWLSWACSLSGGAAREHVRVARALRELPLVDAIFGEGRLTYSKVRELTRLAGRVQEQELCDLATELTASQLARTVRAFRACDGARLEAESRKRMVWRENLDGTVRLSVCLPAEDAALLRAAVERAVVHERPDPAPDQLPLGSTNAEQADALVELARTYLAVGPLDALDDDRHLVVVQVSAESLANSRDVPAGTSGNPDAAATSLVAGTCSIESTGPIEAATASRLVCTASLVGAVVDSTGDVLALGRTRRLASRAQRRALRIRDHGMCQYPGCWATRHVEAHHRAPWAAGGGTDLDNLVLLCGRHHVSVHEGGVHILANPDPGPRWLFVLPDGRPIRAPGDPAPWDAAPWDAAPWDAAPWDAAGAALSLAATPAPAEGPLTQPTPAGSVFPPGGGAGFSLADCVAVLFDIRLDELPLAS